MKYRVRFFRTDKFLGAGLSGVAKGDILCKAFPHMRIEVITTGTELLLGSTMNTHGAFFGQELMKMGLRVQRQLTVPDGDAIHSALKDSLTASDVIIVTGGLGPTSDDLTREACADVLGLDLILDEAALRSMEAFFQSREKPMGDVNKKQAYAPIGCDVLQNPNGTAPGVYVPPRQGGGCAIFLLPGPPRELYPMFHEEVVPRLKALSGVEVIPDVLEMKFVGVGESELQEGIDSQLEALDGLEHGYCARMGECDLRLIGEIVQLGQAREIALARFGKYFVNDEGLSLEQTLVETLAAHHLTLSTVESCTGGLIASRITDVPGSSAVFTHGYVTYANQAKVEMVGVSEIDLEKYGAVSEQVARQMAEGALERSASDLAIAVTGIAGPDGGSAEKPTGTVFMAFARRGEPTEVKHECHPRNRKDFKTAVAQAVLSKVLRQVIGR